VNVTDAEVLAALAGISDTTGGRCVRPAYHTEREEPLEHAMKPTTLDTLNEQAARLRRRLQRVERAIILQRLAAIRAERERADLQPPAASLAVTR
jgi:hypothetical protein